MTLLNHKLDRRRFGSVASLAALLSVAETAPLGAQRSPFAPATPVPASPASDGPLGRLLTMVPRATLDRIASGIPWTYVDLAAQFAALSMHHGLEGPDPGEPVANATLALAGTSPLLAFAMDEEFIAAIGFHPLGLNQFLHIGDPGSQVQLFTAPFDADGLATAWTASGYELVEAVSGIDLWTIGPESDISFDHPVQRRVISSMNNLALVGEVIVATPTLASLREVVEFMEGGGESLLDDPATGPLVATLPTTIASAIAIQPVALDVQPIMLDEAAIQVAERQAIEAEVGPMPPLRGVITAVEAGAFMIESDWSEAGTREETVRPDAGTAYLRLATASPTAAEQVLSVIERRWERLHSVHSDLMYAEIMEIVDGTIHGEVVELDLRQLRQPQAWQQMILSGDVLPLVPDEE